MWACVTIEGVVLLYLVLLLFKVPIRFRFPRRAAFHRFRPRGPTIACISSPDVEKWFKDRLHSPQAQRKRLKAAQSFLRSFDAVREINCADRLQPRLERIVDSAGFAFLYPRTPMAAVGIAGRCITCRGRLILGCESVLWWLGQWLRDSAVDHELTHCVQEIIDKAITCESWGTHRHSPLWIELHAHLWGGRLVFWGAVATLAAVILSGFLLE